jgi:hypothetical protein
MTKPTAAGELTTVELWLYVLAITVAGLAGLAIMLQNL